MKKFLNSILCIFVCLGMVSTLSAQCDYTLTLDDSAGDGWFFQSVFSGNIIEEATLDVLVNGVEVATYPENQDGFASIDFTLTLETDDEVTFVYNTNDGFDNEHSWSLTDPDGAVVFTQAFALSSDATDGEVFGPVTAVCPVAPVPCTVICPDDFFESLESGECNTQVDFVVETEGDCELVVETSFGFTAEWIDRLFVFGSTDANGFTDFSGLPDQLVITSGDDQSGAQELDGALIEVLEDGVFTFDYATENMDVIATGFDILIVQVFDNANMDGFTFQLANQVAGDEVSESGTISLDLTAGQAVGIVVFTFDSSDGPIVATISNASFAVTTDEVVVSTFPIESGDQVDGGTDVTNTAQATDANTGLPVSCTFDITINEFTGTPQDFLQCAGNTNTVSLNNDCTATLGAEDVLIGGPYQCFDDYTVMLTDEEGNVLQPVTNVITGPGRVYYKVEGPNGENPCWNSLIAEDKTAPVLTCMDVSVGCNDATTVAAIGQPTVDETCGGVTITSTDITITGTCADGYLRQIFRTFTATNASGMTDQCTQIITVNRQGLADLDSPALRDYDGFDLPTISCDDPRLGMASQIDENGNPAPVWTGFPTVNGEPATEACGLRVEYEDEVEDVCSGTKKIFRTWTIIDWCVAAGGNANNRLVLTQFIKIEDNTDPVISPDFPTSVNLSTDFDACSADYVIPNPTDFLSDVCSDDALITYTARLDTDGGTLIALPSGGYVAQDLPALGSDVNPDGKSTITYTAEDDCGNQFVFSLDIFVTDQVNPVMDCETFREVTLQNINPDEPALVFAAAFDDGSYDVCSPVTFEVRRMTGCIDFDWTTAGAGVDSDANGFVNIRDTGMGNANPDAPESQQSYYPAVPFSCCDIGSEVMVVLRATDAAGNSNLCMVRVNVVDKAKPVAIAPDDVTIECGEHIPGYDEFLSDVESEEFNTEAFAGTPDNPGAFLGYYNNVTDNCGARVYIRETGALNNCGVGQINRIFVAIDDADNESDPINAEPNHIQRIRVINSDPFDENDITWLPDRLLTCGVDPTPAVTGTPTLNGNDECNVLGMDYEDHDIPVVGNEECRIILRTWKVIDDCQFRLDANGEPVAGYWEDVQVIRIRDRDAPVLDCSPFADNLDPSADPNTCDREVELEIAATGNSCDGETLRYTYKIDVDNDGTFDIPGPDYPGITGIGNVATRRFPIGEHRIKWSVEDFCGNVGEDCEQLFYVVDNTPPNITAITDLDVNIASDDADNAVWASEFEISSFDICSGIDTILVQKPSLGDEQSSPPASASDGITFSCADLGGASDAIVPVDYWVLDGAGNWGYTTVMVNVDDSQGNCGPNDVPTATVAGTIMNEELQTVRNVTVAIDGNATEMPTAFTTDETGEYSFELETMMNYTVEPGRNTPPMAEPGITTFDLILLGQHLVGIQDLDSPYKRIAADINNSGDISSLDYIALRRMILIIDTEFANNTSWRFVEEAYTFPNPTDPFATTFPEAINYNDLSQDQLEADFVAIKIGDLNNSGDPSALNAAGDTRDMDGALVFNMAEQALTAGNVHTVEVKANNFKSIEGYQFTLDFDQNAVEFVDFEAGALALTRENFGFAKLNEGAITTSWNATSGVTVANDEVLFTLTFKAKADAQLSKAIAVDQVRFTSAEAYSNGELFNVAFEFNGKTAGDFALLQNRPNPFRSETVIEFNLPEAAPATLTVYDLSGRTIFTEKVDGTTGLNQVVVNRSDLRGAGVMYYQIDTPTESATMKMIVID